VAGAAACAAQLLFYFALSAGQPSFIVHRVQRVIPIMLFKDDIYSDRVSDFSHSGKHGELEYTVKFAPIHVSGQIIGRRSLSRAEAESLSNARSPPARIDWEKSLRAAARLIIRRAQSAARSMHRFGFPKKSEFAPSKPTQRWDGWASSGSRHVIQFSHGGLLIHINSKHAHCVLSIFPPGAFGCAIGEQKAKGDLFKNMKKRLDRINERP
jgi:hypothetical protein